jgi:hypothetical protein
VQTKIPAETINAGKQKSSWLHLFEKCRTVDFAEQAKLTLQSPHLMWSSAIDTKACDRKVLRPRLAREK